MIGLTAEQHRIMSIFFPYAMRKTQDMATSSGKFVHYTSARVAMSILQHREVWMRQATTMNDFMEIEYGLGCLAETWRSDVASKFKDTVERVFPGLCGEITSLFDSWQPVFKLQTYLTCISEHLESENTTGRLSMWRAYGGNTSVALVMNSMPFIVPSDAFNAYTSPVYYGSRPQFKAQFQQIANSVSDNEDFIGSLDRQIVFNSIFEMFRFAALCTKHPGFHEEREWRIVYSPSFAKSNKLVSDLQDVGGVPQQIYKIPLRNYPEEDFFGAEPNELVNRIIIGPTQYPYAMREAFIELLDKAGVAQAREKVFVSDIPLRQ